MLLWVVTCICTPAMAKGVIESARPFRLSNRSTGGLLPHRSGESGRSYTPLRAWTAPRWVGQARPRRLSGALVYNLLTVDSGWMAAGWSPLYGVAGALREADTRNGRRPRGGPGPLSRVR